MTVITFQKSLFTGISSVVHQVQALQLLTLLLPEENRQMLRVKQRAHTHTHTYMLTLTFRICLILI